MKFDKSYFEQMRKNQEEKKNNEQVKGNVQANNNAGQDKCAQKSGQNKWQDKTEKCAQKNDNKWNKK